MTVWPEREQVREKEGKASSDDSDDNRDEGTWFKDGGHDAPIHQQTKTPQQETSAQKKHHPTKKHGLESWALAASPDDRWQHALWDFALVRLLLWKLLQDHDLLACWTAAFYCDASCIADFFHHSSTLWCIPFLYVQCCFKCCAFWVTNEDVAFWQTVTTFPWDRTAE